MVMGHRFKFDHSNYTCTLCQDNYNDQVKEDDMARACSTNMEKRTAYTILMGEPEGKIPLGRPRRKRVDNIEINVRELGWGGMEWIDLAQDSDRWTALVDTVMNLRIP
jgi:hypothetical protein